MILYTSDTNSEYGIHESEFPDHGSEYRNKESEFGKNASEYEEQNPGDMPVPRMGKGALCYSLIALFCLVVFIIYNLFSHGVYSPFMTWLFLWPLVLGVLPCLILHLMKRLPRPSRFAINAYNSGVAAITVSSLLRGIFEIAGTASPLQTGLWIAGLAMAGAGAVFYLLSGKIPQQLKQQ